MFPFEFAAHLASATFGLAETAAEVFKNESYSVPSEAKVNDKDLGPQAGTFGDAGSAVSGLSAGAAGVAATIAAALGTALMLF